MRIVTKVAVRFSDKVVTVRVKTATSLATKARLTSVVSMTILEMGSTLLRFTKELVGSKY